MTKTLLILGAWAGGWVVLADVAADANVGAVTLAVLSMCGNVAAGLFVWLNSRDKLRYDARLALVEAKAAESDAAKAAAAVAKRAAAEAKDRAAALEVKVAGLAAQNAAQQAEIDRGNAARHDLANFVQTLTGDVDANRERLDQQSKAHKALKETDRRQHDEPDAPHRRKADDPDPQ